MLRSLALLLLFLAAGLHAQADVIVREIDVRGLKSTNRWVVERELYFTVGDTVSKADLVAAHKRLHNLAVFTDAEITADTSGTVVVEVAEAWPILPIFGVSLSRGQFSDIFNDAEKFWSHLEVLLGVSHINFRRNASSLYTYARLGSSNGFFLGYRTRWLSPNRPYAVGARVQYLEVGDRHAAIFDSSRSMQDNAISLEVGTHAGAHGRIGVGTSLQRIEQEKTWPAEGRNYNTFWLSPFMVLDHRDLEWWPSRGGMAEARTDFAFGTVEFVRSQYSLRGYVPLKSWYPPYVPHRPAVLALHVAAATSTSRTPSFAHYYSGFSDGYRGYRGDRAEAATTLSGSAELRFPITRESTYNVPFIGRWGRRWPIGLAGAFFVQRAELQLANTRTELFGFGGAVYLRVPYVQLIEFSSAANKDGEIEYGMKFGVSF